MSSRFLPHRLDVLAWVASGQHLQGQSALADWPRLRAESSAAPPPDASVQWRLQGGHARLPDGSERPVLDLQAHATLVQVCQRCLQDTPVPLAVQRRFVFVTDEASAQALDDDLEDDVLVIGHDFDALALVEDELIMAIPLVPRHTVCPQALPTVAADPGADTPVEHPFAALAALKTKR